MILPVYVQRPCEPKSTRQVGYADADLLVDEVADAVGVPTGCLITGKVMKRKGVRCWSLVADVTFVERH